MQIDFSKMTLDELTPIISMRPGKEYSREDLHAARAAFMDKLSHSDEAADTAASEKAEEKKQEMSEQAPSSENDTQETDITFKNTAQPEGETATPDSLDPSAPFLSPVNALQDASLRKDAEGDTKKEETSVFPTVPNIPAVKMASSVNSDTIIFPAADTVQKDLPLSFDKKIPTVETSVEKTIEKEEFVLKSESRLARVLYILYAYFLVPLLAIESLVFLIASVAVAIFAPNTSHLVLHVLCAALYTMLVSIAWHQFMHRTKFGLILNRSLIAVCIVRGISMAFTGTDLFTGIIFAAAFSLYLIFFIAYDNTFVIPPEKSHVQ